MNNNEFNAAIAELQKTTVGGVKIKWPPTAGNAHWYNAYNMLSSARRNFVPIVDGERKVGKTLTIGVIKL